VADRSGEVLLRELPITGLTWGRVVDDVSSATTRLSMSNGAAGVECCRAVAGLARYGYEIVIFRNGFRVHTGPVVDIVVRGEDIEIVSEDKMGWLKVRVVSSELDYPPPGEEMSIIFNDVVTNAMAPDNVPGLIATAIPTGIRAERNYTPANPIHAYDAIQELARTGIDYTMVGPDMYAGSFVVPAAPLALFTDQALAELPDVSFLGPDYASQWYVTGDPDQNLVGSYGGVDPVSGLVVRLAQEDDISDQASLDQNAKSRWELTNGPFVGEVTLTLDPSAPLPMELIIPGAAIDLRLAETCFPLIGEFRIKSLNVAVSSGGDGPDEVVRVTLEPIGTEIVE